LAFLAGCEGQDIAKFLPDRPWTRHVIDDSSRGADGVRLADVNRDGLPDIATGWEEGGLIRVYLNPGPVAAKRRWPAVTVGKVDSPEDAVFADLDADGAVDVISSCEGKNRSIYVHWAPGDQTKYPHPTAWQTEPLPEAKGRQQWMFCLPMQVDGKNGIDLVAGAKGDNAQIGWFEAPNAQIGWFEAPANARNLDGWQWHPLYNAGWIMSLVTHDMDGDGDLDIVASDRKGTSRGNLWLENPGAGISQSLPWPEHRIGGSDKQVMFLTLTDFNQDGTIDVLAAISGQELLYHRRTSDNPIRWQSSTIQLPDDTGTGKAVAVGDIDRNGKQDIVFTCENAKDNKSGVMWMSSSSGFVWRNHDISGPEGVKYDLVELIDLDADGDLDVLTCEEKTNLGVIWYENPTIQ
jgi:hypothetical protein